MEDMLTRYRQALKEADNTTVTGRNKIATLIHMAERSKEFYDAAIEAGYEVPIQPVEVKTA